MKSVASVIECYPASSGKRAGGLEAKVRGLDCFPKFDVSTRSSRTKRPARLSVTNRGWSKADSTFTVSGPRKIETLHSAGQRGHSRVKRFAGHKTANRRGWADLLAGAI